MTNNPASDLQGVKAGKPSICAAAHIGGDPGFTPITPLWRSTMLKYQATWRPAPETSASRASVDRVGKTFTAPNLLEAKKIASQLPTKGMTLIKVVEISGNESSDTPHGEMAG